MRDAAIAAARRGFRVFPLSPGGKVPITEGWTQSATSDLMDVLELWTDDDGDAQPYNVGILTTGMVVLDADEKDGRKGRAELAELEAQSPLPETLRVRTPTGGVHVYLAGYDAGQTPLSRGIDVRSHNGYVLAPGSEIDGKPYTIEHDAPVAPCPDPVKSRLRMAADKSALAALPVSELDTPANISAALAWLKSEAPLAVEGDGGDATTYRVACKMLDFGLSEGEALELLLRFWNDRCSPPWDAADLEKKLESAGLYRQEPVGVLSPDTHFPKAPQGFGLFVRDFSLTPQSVAEMPARPWLADRRLLRGKITTLVAPTSVGKSVLTLQWGAALALGRGDWTALDVRERTRALILNNEDEHDEIERRLAAICQHFNLPWKELEGWFRYFSGVDNPLKLITKRDRNSPLEINEAAQKLEDYIRDERIGYVVADPLVELHEADENDNGQMSRVAQLFRRIAVKTQCAMLLVHHTRKPPTAPNGGYAGSVDASRGAGSLQAAARVKLTMFGMSEADGLQYDVAPEERNRYVRLDDAAANLYLISNSAQWYRRQSVMLANGDDMGVLVPTRLDCLEQQGMDAFLALAGEAIRAGAGTVARVVACLARDPRYHGATDKALKRRLEGYNGSRVGDQLLTITSEGHTLLT